MIAFRLGGQDFGMQTGTDQIARASFVCQR
jgi:hypothetical protein